jgi:hypothetical protein
VSVATGQRQPENGEDGTAGYRAIRRSGEGWLKAHRLGDLRKVKVRVPKRRHGKAEVTTTALLFSTRRKPTPLWRQRSFKKGSLQKEKIKEEEALPSVSIRGFPATIAGVVLLQP